MQLHFSWASLCGVMEARALTLARKLLTRAWSGQSMLDGVDAMLVKDELPDDPDELKAYIEEPASLNCP